MKASNKLAVLLSVGALLPLAASAKTVEQAYLETCLKDPSVPVPTVVVSPRVQSGAIGESVELEFTVDTTGKATGFSVKSSSDYSLTAAVEDAVKQWQFTPAQRDGVPVATKVLLPVHVVAAAAADGYTSN